MALLLLAVLPALIAAYAIYAGNEADATPQGYVVLGNMPEPPKPNQLGGDILEPVDILAPDDTAQVVIIEPAAPAGTDEMVGAQEPDPASTPRIMTSRPTSVVTINGRPVSPGETAYVGNRPPAPGRYVPEGGNNSVPLARAPIPGYSRQSPFGPIPAPNAAGNTPFEAYAKPFAARKNSRKVAVIVKGLGLYPPVTQRAIDQLPPEVTLSFAPHAPNLQSWINKARAKGHEVVLEVPMEPFNLAQEDPASIPPNMLLVNARPADNARALDRILSSAQGYFAVTDYYGGLFLDSPIKAVPAFTQLRETGLGFVYSENDVNGRISALASNMPWTQARAYIDMDESAGAVSDTLLALEASTNPGGNIPMGVGSAFPGTIDGIIFWAQGLEQRGTIIVPVSYKIKNNP